MNKKKKILIPITIIVIIIIALVGFYFYKNNVETKAYNKTLTTFTTLNKELTTLPKNPSQDVLKGYATSLNNLTTSFNNLGNSFFLNSSIKTSAKNYAAASNYLLCKDNLNIAFYTLLDNFNKIPNPTIPDTTNLVNNINGLLSNQNFIEMENIYNTNAFVKSQQSSNSPNELKTYIEELSKQYNELITGLSEAFNS
ncbi:MAG: hypothetical protein ACRDDY_03165 [Clostridium sp.]|uniref:hypothetical protein n=1 Tax=Clostridium sp. TaxID=1506 RepID=UPI003EE44F02